MDFRDGMAEAINRMTTAKYLREQKREAKRLMKATINHYQKLITGATTPEEIAKAKSELYMDRFDIKPRAWRTLYFSAERKAKLIDKEIKRKLRLLENRLAFVDRFKPINFDLPEVN